MRKQHVEYLLGYVYTVIQLFIQKIDQRRFEFNKHKPPDKILQVFLLQEDFSLLHQNPNDRGEWVCLRESELNERLFHQMVLFKDHQIAFLWKSLLEIKFWYVHLDQSIFVKDKFYFRVDGD